MQLGERAGLKPAKRMREVFGDALLDLCRQNPRVVVLDGDLANTTKTLAVRHEFPERFFNIGLAENNMVSIGAGLADLRRRSHAQRGRRARSSRRRSTCYAAVWAATSPAS